MDSKLTDLQRAEMRVRTQRLQLEQKDRRLYEYRQEVDDLQDRISKLHAQKLIHPTDRPGEGN